MICEKCGDEKVEIDEGCYYCKKCSEITIVEPITVYVGKTKEVA